jgi:hypothetical protein
MAGTVEAPVNSPARLQHRRFPALIAVGAALGGSGDSRVDLPRGLPGAGTRPWRSPDGNAGRRAALRAGTVRKLTASNGSRAIEEG